MKRIIALIDLSDSTSSVVKISREMAQAFNCELCLVHVVAPNSEVVQDDLEDDVAPPTSTNRSHHRQMELLKMALLKEGINTVAIVLPTQEPDGNPVDAILEETTRLNPDLVVIGSHGHGRLRWLLAGSVTDSVSRKVTCPVLLVPCRKAEPHPI